MPLKNGGLQNAKKRDFSRNVFITIPDDSDSRFSGMESERCGENHGKGLEKRFCGGSEESEAVCGCHSI